MNELRIGDVVTIRYSKKLEQSGHSILVNRQGEVTRIVLTSGQISGAYVDVIVMRRVRNYYIPINSIEGPDTINRMRTLSMLKSTVL